MKKSKTGCAIGKVSFRWLLILTFATIANGQRAQMLPDCRRGTPIPFNVENHWGYVTDSGIVIPPRFISAGPFSGDIATVCTAQGCVLIDRKGQFVSPIVAREKSLFGTRYSEGIGAVEKDGKWGYADVSGNVVIPLQFEYAGDFNDGMARVRSGDKFFFINLQGTRSILQVALAKLPVNQTGFLFAARPFYA